MAVYTVAITTCPSGGHVYFNVTRDGTPAGKYIFNRDELNNPDLLNLQPEHIIYTLARNAIKDAGATTPAQIKAAVESKTWNW